MNAKSTRFGLERATSNRRAGVWTIVGLLLVPLVVAGGFLWAGWNSTDRLDRIQAAIVNQDRPVKLDGQLVPLGRQLSGGLAANSDDPNFDWVITNSEDAEAGLGSGRYAAVVTIPENFSARATSFSKDKASQIRPAVIDVQTSQIAGLADPVVGQAITASATKVVNSTLTESYLKNIYLGFNKTGKQFETLANAAGDLSDGTNKLADGLGKSADGTEKFANGLVKLGYGAEQLADGVGELNTGATELADGMDTLAANTADLPKQTRKLADGVGASATGAKKLSTGATKLSHGIDQLSTGAGTYAKGAAAYAKGTRTFAQGTAQQAAGSAEYAKKITEYADGSSKYANGAAQYADGIATFQQQISKLTVDAIPCPTSLPAEACAAFQDGVRAGAGVALQGLGTEEDPGLAAGARELADGSQGLADGSAKLAVGANALADGSSKLNKGAGQLSTGAKGLATGAKKLDSGLNQLNTGAGQLATGLAQLATGLSKAATGSDQLATGIGELVPGIDKLATGVRGLATGIDTLDAGASGLADGAQKSAEGGQALNSGIGKLAKGGDKLADGTDKFATGLEKGKDKVPSFDKSLRDTLSSVVTTPVRSDAARTIFPDAASTTLLMVIALWLSGLATFLILRALPSRILSSMRPSWRLALEGVLPGVAVGVVQAGVLTAVLSALLDLDASEVGALTALALLAAVTFAVLNHALVAWLGGVGRFISVVVVVIAAAGSITSALPKAFDTLTPLLPTTPALDGLRAIVTDGTGAGSAAALLVAWLIVGLVASIVAVARRRMLVAANPARTLVPQG